MLTAKQEAFVNGIIEGKSQTDAYKAAYNTARMSQKTIIDEAHNLSQNPKIIARLEELRAEMITPAIMSARERLEYLTGVIQGKHGEKIVTVVDGETVETEIPASMKNKLTAIDIMNKMQGEYTQKIEAEVKMKKLEDLL